MVRKPFSSGQKSILRPFSSLLEANLVNKRILRFSLLEPEVPNITFTPDNISTLLRPCESPWKQNYIACGIEIIKGLEFEDFPEVST